jgi:flagellar biosynthesis/type III secretory pathway M-ring protein FliF/YscJ
MCASARRSNRKKPSPFYAPFFLTSPLPVLFSLVFILILIFFIWLLALSELSRYPAAAVRAQQDKQGDL